MEINLPSRPSHRKSEVFIQDAQVVGGRACKVGDASLELSLRKSHANRSTGDP